MTNQIPPALTPKEWGVKACYRDKHEILTDGIAVFVAAMDDKSAWVESVNIASDALPAFIALANDTLPNSDRKITASHVVAIAIAAQHAREKATCHLEGSTEQVMARAQSLALDRVVAILLSYLPPDALSKPGSLYLQDPNTITHSPTDASQT